MHSAECSSSISLKKNTKLAPAHMLEAIQSLSQFVTSPSAMTWMMVGTMLGIIVGAIPGLTGAMLIALTLPLTFSMSGENALVLLVSMYVGSVSGGLISATLLKIPGTPASMMTTFDGYPLAEQGKARRALGLGIAASFVGGVVGWFFLVMLTKPLASLSLMLGPFEFFALVLVALVLIATVSEDSLLRGLFSGAFGILLAIPGMNPANGVPRWTLGFSQLEDGFKLLPVLIGLFAITQVITAAGSISSESQTPTAQPQDGSRILLGLREYSRNAMNLVRSSLIGVFVGILPGVGANIGSVVAYSAAKGMSKTPEQFGSGSEEGIIASEAANNATVGGALIPLIAMGIPGSVIDAILIGALTIHGLQPGPLLMEQNPDAANMMMATILVANLFMFAFMLLAAPWLARLATVPQAILVPTIVTFCVIGSFALANRMFDVWVMFGFGVIGLAMNKLRVPLAPFVIGFVLAPIAEEQIIEGLMQSGGSWLPLFTRPVALVMLLVASGIMSLSVLARLRANYRRETNR